MKRSIPKHFSQLEEIMAQMTNIITRGIEPALMAEDAETLAVAFTNFSKIVKAHKNIPFEYMDVLRRENTYYPCGYVPTLNNINGNILLTTFDHLYKASQIVIQKGGKQIPYPDHLKVGNEAIGQVWLEDGTEVFSPRHALSHSMISSSKMIRDWASLFERRMKAFYRIH